MNPRRISFDRGRRHADRRDNQLYVMLCAIGVILLLIAVIYFYLESNKIVIIKTI